MGLPWVRLDTQFPHNPKVLALTNTRRWRALSVYLCSLAYCGAQGTDGFITPDALPIIHGDRRTAEQLVDVGLWRVDGAGWELPDWKEYQPSNEQNAKRREKARRAAWKRWHPEDVMP